MSSRRLAALRRSNPAVVRRVAQSGTILGIVVVGLALSLLGACKKELPPPWGAMAFPIGAAELLPGADANGFTLTYKASGQQADLFREFQNGLERGGYAFERNGSSHDPTNNAFAAIHKKGDARVLLTVAGDKPVQVRITTRVD